jgi:site-specific recombinase XerD
MNVQNNTFGVAFYLKKQKVTQLGKSPIYARITVNGKRIEISVKRSVEEQNWNAAKGMARGSREEIVKLNKYLDQFKSGIIESYQELALQRKLITPELLKGRVTGGDQAEFTLSKLVEHHNKEQGQLLEWGTMKNYYTTQKYLVEFLKERHKTSDKYLSELNYKFITDFEYYLRNRKPEKGQKKLATNGLMKHLERFCKMVNMAVRLEWIERNPFHAYQLKFDKVNRDYLTKDELQRIESKKFHIIRLQVVQDLFIFSCYTGLAYIDVYNLTPANLVNGSDGNLWIMTNRQKTNTAVKVPLLPKALEIIDKYKGHPQAIADGKVLPTLTNQKLNSYLKEIADMCDILKPLTFHIARHTFATTITLTNGVPIESVSKMLGHTKLSTTQVYAKVVESKLADDMAKLSKRLKR